MKETTKAQIKNKYDKGNVEEARKKLLISKYQKIK